jgi:hypothetical protein
MENKELDLIINNKVNNNIINNKNNKNSKDNNNIISVKKNNNKIFKSASLTFYSKELGYLFCEEFRYKEKKILLHPIGGKVENFDKDIFSTAIREFIEEVNLEIHPKININKYDKNMLTDDLYKILQNISYYIDLCINKEKKYFHRYFLVLIDDIRDIEFKKDIIDLPNYFNGKYKTEINNVCWYVLLTEKENILNLSWLTKMFINFVIKKNI